MPKTGSMAVLGHEGETKHMWDKDNPDEVAAAQGLWDDLVGQKKYMAFSVKFNGERDERIRTFDPTAEKVILVPPLVGG